MVRKKSEPALRFDQVEFGVGTFELVLSDDEKRDALANLTGDARDRFVATLEPGEEARLKRKAKKPDPTAPAPSS